MNTAALINIHGKASESLCARYSAFANEIVTTFDNVSNLIQTKVDMHNRAIDKEEQKAAAYLQDQDNKGRTNVAMAPSGRGALVEKESVQDYWTPTMTAEILIYAYGIIAATMTR